ncbi:MAG: hypothetical protein P1U44_08075 [Vicingaceae bacterium]|jgi:ABC-type methionine transport system ATPase subunit|nr:hypothetical protein [Flavobacteriales bacterium]MBQ20928.1 hypothetical protein [Flavobacteriales bacterium]MDF1675663.1 hypothetical protein [Vicingaceae bacterium]|tara:strand:- start:129417 stop:129785 length:369 start_codon:yes stop_codon:yes gene_type:complete
MKFFKPLVLFIHLFIFGAVNLFSQTTATNQQEVTTMYYYDFSGELSATSISEIETEVSQLVNVSETKVKYKEEKRLGQLVVIVKEKPRKSEGDILFQPTDLKKIISQHGLMPKEIKFETINP